MKSIYLSLIFLGLFALNLNAQCDNVTTGGLIGTDQHFCEVSEADPGLITNIELPSGGSGDIEILWIFTTQNPEDGTTVWYPIQNSNTTEFDPPIITETTYYRRCTRSAGCAEYIGESNYITVSIENDCNSGGGNPECDIFKININGTNPASCDLANGTLNMDVVGGLMPFNYNLNGNDLTSLPTTYAVGEYTLIITDAMGCSDEEVFVIDNIAPQIIINAAIIDPNCSINNGSITLDIEGLSDNYSILWENGNTDLVRENLTAGSFSVTVTDENNCTSSSSFTLNSGQSNILLDLWPNDISCFGANDGSAELTISGGVFPYNISLNGIEIEEINNLSAGDYFLLVSDNNGCSSEAIFTVNEPSPIQVNASITEPTCGANNGNISLNISGGTLSDSEDYVIEWNNGNGQNLSEGIYTVQISDSNGCSINETFTLSGSENTLFIDVITNPVSCFGGDDGIGIISVFGGQEPYSYEINGEYYNELPINYTAGDYFINVSDANGCSASTLFSILQAEELSLFITSTDAGCGGENGSISVTAGGGTGTYSYLWSNGETTQSINGLNGGAYFVTLTDENNCSISNDEPIIISQIGSLNINSNVTDAACGENNGSISIEIIGGTAPYSIIWNDAVENVQEINNLTAGIYSVLIIDANDCSVEQEFVIGNIGGVSVQTTVTNVSCHGGNDGSANLGFTGGQAPFSFNLNGENLSAFPTNLAADDYQLIITDSNGCTALTEFTITQPEPIIYLAEITDPICSDGTGSIVLQAVLGGTGNYSFLWSDGSVEQNRTSLEAGSYALTISDDNNCTISSENFLIIPPVSLNVFHQITNISCFDSNDGSIDVEVVGGTPPYSYFWSTGAVSQDLDNLNPGEYMLQVIDQNGCSLEFIAFISNPPAELDAVADITDANCGQMDGMVTINPAGGTAPYFYEWPSGNIEATETGLTKGEYSVLITDFAGCSMTITFFVDEVGCFDEENGGDFNFLVVDVSSDEENGTVALHWMTEYEAIESYFLVEHSMDGENYESISELMPGYGFSLTENEYFNELDETRGGMHYFRIKYVDTNGNLIISDIVEVLVNPDNSASFSIFPNPAANLVTLNFYTPLEGNASLQLVNSQAGIKKDITIPTGTLRYTMDIESEIPGVYYLVLLKDGQRLISQKLIRMD